ncbi:MAG: hypothetical protein LBT99_03030 [Bifidobacteriaceae bacterium]|jgi:N-acetylglucosamine kinase-like BadF-type ATPase|nr:hypothetical protein [Bifidobacteriaceae bacterium]
MDFIVGFDCGATSTKLQVYSTNGQKILNLSDGPANFTLNFNNSANNVLTLLAELLTKLGKTGKCQLCVIGAAGIEAGDNKAKLAKLIVKQFPQLLNKVIIINDAQLAHLAKLEGQIGILAVSGTGSIILSNFNNIWKITGGRGYLLGDQGSAHWLGLQALKNIMNEIDNNKPPSSQSKNIYKKIGVKENNRGDILSWTYKAPRSDIAALAILVDDNTLLNKAGEELVKQIIEASSFTNEMHIKVAFNGSVIEKNQIVQKAIITKLEKSNKNFSIIKSNNPANMGSLFLYKQLQKTKTS